MMPDGCRLQVLGEVQAILCPPDPEELPRPVLAVQDLAGHPVVTAALVIDHQVRVAEYVISPEGTIRRWFRWMLKVVILALIILPPILLITTLLAAIAQALAVMVWSLVIAWIGLCVLVAFLRR
jgi:hypothetical protein